MNIYVSFILVFIAMFSQFSHSSVSDLSLPSKNIMSTQVPLTVFLVRHAEKLDAGRDPELSESGKKRALTLANMLKDTKIQHIHSSDYIRTRETAAPSAAQLALNVSIYDPRKLEDFAREVKAQGGTHLIVGHSNTTPEMVSLLGGDAISPIDDAKEFDRLYIVTIAVDGSVSSILMRYGKPYNKGDF